MRTLRRVRLWIALALAACAGAAAAKDLYHVGGPWQDDRGQAVRLESFYGTPTVLTMAYGACRRVCSTSLRMMEQLQRLADERHQALNFVIVGIDPQADRPRDWAEFRAERHLTRPNWFFLSGDETSTRQLAKRLGVRYWRYDEHTLHDLRIVLLSPDAQPLRSVQAFDQDVAILLP